MYYIYIILMIGNMTSEYPSKQREAILVREQSRL